MFIMLQAFSLSSVAKGQACRELQGKGQMSKFNRINSKKLQQLIGLFNCVFPVYSWLFNVAQNKNENRELVLETFKALNSWMKMICIFEWPDLFQFVDLLCNSVVTFVDLNDSDIGDIVIEILSGIVSCNYLVVSSYVI